MGGKEGWFILRVVVATQHKKSKAKRVERAELQVVGSFMCV